jgi:flagellar motor switch protein FliN/FliY
MENETSSSAHPVSVRPVQLEDVKNGAESTHSVVNGSLELVHDVKVRLMISVGGAQISIGELYALKDGAVLKLDKATNDPVDVFLDAKLVARGELMVSEDCFAIRITEIGSAA